MRTLENTPEVPAKKPTPEQLMQDFYKHWEEGQKNKCDFYNKLATAYEKRYSTYSLRPLYSSMKNR